MNLIDTPLPEGRNQERVAEEYRRKTPPRDRLRRRLETLDYFPAEVQLCLSAFDYLTPERHDWWADLAARKGERLQRAWEITLFGFTKGIPIKDSPPREPKEPPFSVQVGRELTRARGKHPKAMSSFHDGYATILEEVDELWDEVKKQTSARNHGLILKELVQIGAMAQRMAEDLNLISR